GRSLRARGRGARHYARRGRRQHRSRGRAGGREAVSTLRRPSDGIGAMFIVSLVLHVAVVAPFVIWKAAPDAALPPMYKVDLVGAPAGERQMGVVRETPPAAEPTAKAPPKAATTDNAKTAPINAPSKRAPTRATPN